MQKQLISICTTVIFVFSIYGCSQTAENVLATETKNAGLQATGTERGNTSTEGEWNKTVVEKEHETAPMPDAAKQDMFTYIVNDNGAVITGLQAEYKNSLQENMSEDREIKIPDTLDGYSVVEIGDHAFENTTLKSVHIPESVEVIGNSAFRNTDLENVNLSQCNHLKEVKASAFENCNLHDQDYSTWFMEKIGARAFAGNEQLTRVNFWSGDVTIEKDAFDKCGDEMLFYIEWSKEETGKEVETYAAANGIQVEYSVTTQINVPSKPLLLTPEIGSFFYGELGGTYDDWGADMWCSFEEAPDAPNFGFEDWQWIGCSKQRVLELASISSMTRLYLEVL